jgi:putative cardiolipin synthase
VHSAYAGYRRDLLKGGMALYELRAQNGQVSLTTGGTSSGVSLHAKALVVDRRHVFVGSMNMDPRSALLNTEMGVIVDSKPLAAAMVAYFDEATDPHNAYRVVLEPVEAGSQRRELHWIAKDGDKVVRYYHDPDVSAWRRAQVLLMRLLPVEGLL